MIVLQLAAAIGCASLVWIAWYVAKISDHLGEIAHQLQKTGRINDHLADIATRMKKESIS